MKNHLFFLFLIFVSCSAPQKQGMVLSEGDPAAAGFSPERLDRIDNIIKQGIDSGWIAGATGFIARNGKIVYNRAFGYRDIEKKTPLKSDDIFRIASQTKAIASAAVMTLFEEGKFLLDDPVSKYIPEFAHPVVIDRYNDSDTTWTSVPASREITIRHLLTHTSGIEYAGIGSPMMRAIYAKAGIPPGFGTDKAAIGEKMKILGRLPLLHNPGDRYTYGLNVDVLGYLVEVWSGMSFDEYLHKRIFEPLDMKDSYFYLPESKSDRLVKVGTYDRTGKLINASGDFINYPLIKGTYYSGGAGLSSTISDYAKFLQMMLNGGVYGGNRILSRRTVELMTSNQIGDIDRGLNKFGLGFEITSEAGQAVLGITKGSFSWGGYFGTIYWADPQERIVALLFLQQSPLRHGEIQNKFKAMVYQALND